MTEREPTEEDRREQAFELLASGDAREAWSWLRPVLEFPARPRDLAAALEVLAAVGAAISGDAFAAKVRAAAERTHDAVALYECGYELIEVGLPGAAATVLREANELVPGDATILCELCAALERAGHNAEAARFLRAAPELVASSFLCRYLLAYNALATGDRDEPARLLDQLLADADPRHVPLAKRIEGALARARAIEAVTPLDDRDLRGWHLVLAGSLLLHLSPHGLDEPMRGRYAYVCDSEEVCLEGVRRLAATLEALELAPPRVFAMPDRNSTVLATAVAALLDLPLSGWHPEGSDEPGLIVAYDLADSDGIALRSVAGHRPGQVLFAHAQSWTEDHPIAGDATTFLHQFNAPPWGERMRFDAGTRSVEKVPPSDEPPSALAAGVARAELPPDALADLPALIALARAAATLRGEHAIGALRSAGTRRKFFAGSPVPSARFA